MNAFGFILPTVGFQVPQGNVVVDDSTLLGPLGLSDALLDAGNCDLATEKMNVSVTRIGEFSCPVDSKIKITRAILKWQSLASQTLRENVIQKCQGLIFNVISSILCNTDDDNLQQNYTFGNQVPGELLAKFIYQEVQDSLSLSDKIVSDIEQILESVVNSKVPMSEKVLDSSSNNTAESVRVETIRYLVKSLPATVDDVNTEKTIVRMVFRIRNFLDMRCPTLQTDMINILYNFLSSDASDDVAAVDPKFFEFMWDEFIGDMIRAVKCGHVQLRPFLVRNKKLLTPESPVLSEHLGNLIEIFGFDDKICRLLQDLSEADALKMSKSIAVFVKYLETVENREKCLILGCLLAVSLSDNGVAVAPHINQISSHCSTNPLLFVPFFKLLTVTSKVGEEVAIQCLYLVVKLAKSGQLTLPSDQKALLDTIDIIKDRFSYCNIFHPDTLRLLESYSPSSNNTYKNIITWNSGKKARKGQQHKFLLSGGLGSGKKGFSGSVRKVMSLRAFSSPARSTIGSRNSTPAAGSAVSPSPFSQVVNQARQDQLQRQQTQPVRLSQPVVGPDGNTVPFPPIGQTGISPLSAPNQQFAPTPSTIGQNTNGSSLFDSSALSPMTPIQTTAPATSVTIGTEETAQNRDLFGALGAPLNTPLATENTNNNVEPSLTVPSLQRGTSVVGDPSLNNPPLSEGASGVATGSPTRKMFKSTSIGWLLHGSSSPPPAESTGEISSVEPQQQTMAKSPSKGWFGSLGISSNSTNQSAQPTSDISTTGAGADPILSGSVGGNKETLAEFTARQNGQGQTSGGENHSGENQDNSQGMRNRSNSKVRFSLFSGSSNTQQNTDNSNNTETMTKSPSKGWFSFGGSSNTTEAPAPPATNVIMVQPVADKPESFSEFLSRQQNQNQPSPVGTAPSTSNNSTEDQHGAVMGAASNQQAESVSRPAEATNSPRKSSMWSAVTGNMKKKNTVGIIHEESSSMPQMTT